ncbi:hypothetical protein P3X46_021596 [Hevea brasiliensis]|uniref:Carboxymethylenebutenolidase homolog n=1 Tax=Hevea brasiliensis TaxID=3981 RepID=A0ABQ9LG31_HEVBR|nr:hypothetical protein P3X46_021596 [Hevea brasiliensis]
MRLASPTTASSSFWIIAAAAATRPSSSLHRGLHFLSTSSSPLLPSFRRCNLDSQRSSIGKVEEDINDEACELVNGVELSIGKGADTISAYLFKAVKNNNGTGILLLSDVFGFEDSSTRDFAYRVACNGYNVLVPDLFRGDPWAKDLPKTKFEQWIAKQEPQRVAKDITTATKWMADEIFSCRNFKEAGHNWVLLWRRPSDRGAIERPRSLFWHSGLLLWYKDASISSFQCKSSRIFYFRGQRSAMLSQCLERYREEHVSGVKGSRLPGKRSWLCPSS